MGNATVADTGMGLNAAGGIFSAFGKYYEGQSQAAMYNYRAAIADLNQKIALQNRDYALGSGEEKAINYGMGAAQTFGLIRAAQGASNIDVGSGSSVNVRQGQMLKTAMDMNMIRTNAARVAYGYEAEAAQDVAQAGLYRMAASTSERSGEIGALGSLVSTAGGVADKWLQQGQYFSS